MYIFNVHKMIKYEKLQDKPYDIEIPIDLSIEIPKPIKGNGVVYYIRCKESGKGYIGQALNYVNGNTMWGTEGRWKSHVREALGGSVDHCRLLNNAIRKYGKDAFEIYTFIEDEESKLDEHEVFFIDVFQTLTPNGYNLEKGGRKNKEISDETRKRVSEGNKNKIVSDDTRLLVSQNQLGLSRPKTKKYEEDRDLPTGIAARRKNGKIINYMLSFPIGIEFKEYINKDFKNLDDAKKYLEKLKIEYADRNNKIIEMRKERDLNRTDNKARTIAKKNLPEFINPYIRNGRIDGYYVEGYLDINNKPYPKKDFTELSCNLKNLNAAKRYLQKLNNDNKDALFKEIIPPDLLNKGVLSKTNKMSPDTRKLPKFLTYVIVNNQKIGYQINNFPLNNTFVKKKFCNTHETMEDKYNRSVNLLKELWKKSDALNNNTANKSNELLSENDNNIIENTNDNNLNDYMTDDTDYSSHDSDNIDDLFI